MAHHPPLLWPRADGGEGMHVTWPGSVFATLAILSRKLAETYFWSPAEATWFVLIDLTWNARMDAWDRQYPQWQYENVRQFCGALSRAEKQMLRPQSALARQRKRFRASS